MQYALRRLRTARLLLCAVVLSTAIPGEAVEHKHETNEAAISWPPLPEAVASFGAAIAGDSLYVYGGHVGKTHAHSIENLFHRFIRLDLTDPAAGWQDLGEVRGLQGLPLVAAGDRVCRIGGLEAHNHRGDEEDLWSVAEVSCYDVARGTWQDLPPLPAPRSSHDAVFAGGKLIVAGGWRLRGAGEDPVWHHTTEILDLQAAAPAWRSVPQPFARRALAVAAAGGNVVAFGGLGEDGTSRRVDVFDLDSETWSRGPDLPEMDERLKGFGLAAFGIGDRIYLSGSDGVVHALLGDRWLERLAELETPRFFHRLLPYRDRLLFVAGAAAGGHLAGIESIDLDDLTASETPRRPALPEAAGSRAWPGFRGLAQGRTAAVDLPREWSADRNVAWWIDVEGFGQSSPVAWNDRAFVTSVAGEQKEILLLSAFDLEDGTLLWRRRFAATQRIANRDTASRAAPTPAVDEERIYAFWESGDLVALDHRGRTIWQRSLTADYGPARGNHGIASSPVLAGDALIVQVTHDGPSYVIAVDRASGETRWRVERPAKVAWTTPVVAAAGAEGETEIVISVPNRVEALAAASGERRWLFSGVERNAVASPLVDGEALIIPSSAAGQNLALRRGARGVLEEEDVLWRADAVASGFGSPVVQGPCVLLVNKAGTVACVDRRSGAVRWRHRLGDACWASPIASDGLVYFFTKSGTTVVLRPLASGPQVVAENALPVDGTVYGVGAVSGAFLVRTGRGLIRIGSTGAVTDDAAAGR